MNRISGKHVGKRLLVTRGVYTIPHEVLVKEISSNKKYVLLKWKNRLNATWDNIDDFEILDILTRKKK